MPGPKGCTAISTGNSSGQACASSCALSVGSNGLFCVPLHLSFPPSINKDHHRQPHNGEISHLLPNNGMGRQRARKKVVFFWPYPCHWPDPLQSKDWAKCIISTGAREEPVNNLICRSFIRLRGDPRVESLLYFQPHREDAGCIHIITHSRQSLFKTVFTFLVAFRTKHAEQYFFLLRISSRSKGYTNEAN